MPRRVSRLLATPGALLLTLVLAGQTFAAGWADPVKLSSSGNAQAGGLVALAGSNVVVAYTDSGAIFVRRSTDSGLSWQPRQQIADVGSEVTIAGRGHIVDLAWSTGKAVRYVRSADAGISFSSPVSLATRSAGGLATPAVARGPDDVVAVAWTRDGIARARVSRDGGESFGPITTLNNLVEQAVTAIAVGNHVVYVATAGLIIGCDGECAAGAFGIWRSLDLGATWDESMLKAESGAVTSIDAVGNRAFAGAAYSPSWSLYAEAMYFKTTNRGRHWSGPRTIAAQDGDIGGPVVVAVRDGRLRAAWTFDHTLDDGPYQLAYRERELGQPWLPVEILTELGNPRAAGVGFSGRAVVLYSATEDDGSATECCSVVRAITRAP